MMSGRFSVGRMYLEEWLWNFRGQEVLLVAASLGEREVPVWCRLCGFEYRHSGCPSCRREAAEASELVERRRSLFEEIDEFLADGNRQ